MQVVITAVGPDNVGRLEKIDPSLEDVFVSLVEEKGREEIPKMSK